MATTLEQDLEACQALIAELQSAQGLISNSSAAGQVRRERLDKLYAERRQLRRDIRDQNARDSGSSRFWTGRQGGNSGGGPF